MESTRHTEEMKDTLKCKVSLCSQIDRTNLVKLATLLKAIYEFTAIPNKIKMTFFVELEKPVLK